MSKHPGIAPGLEDNLTQWSNRATTSSKGLFPISLYCWRSGCKKKKQQNDLFLSEINPFQGCTTHRFNINILMCNSHIPKHLSTCALPIMPDDRLVEDTLYKCTNVCTLTTDCLYLIKFTNIFSSHNLYRRKKDVSVFSNIVQPSSIQSDNILKEPGLNHIIAIQVSS